jgi:membrane-associated protease RseP (regulator of RpoE activity)
MNYYFLFNNGYTVNFVINYHNNLAEEIQNTLKGQHEEERFGGEIRKLKKPFSVWVNVVLFIATIITTTLAGVFWVGKDPYDLGNFSIGLTYSFLILLFLTFHEFGHYFAARFHKVKVTLPFYIPFPFVEGNFGTMGAVIRIKDHIRSKKALFDIGIAGPIAGYVVAAGTLVYGLMNLPGIDYLYSVHPEYALTGIPSGGLTFSDTLLYYLLKKIIPIPANGFLPPMNEIYHYPYLCAGWFGLFVTSLNLMPIGQLDGGHITYALLGSKHRIIARVFFVLLGFMTVIGLLNYFGLANYPDFGSIMWGIWLLLILFVIKIDHPPFHDPQDLGTGRKLLGLFALWMFISSFIPAPVKDM